MRASLALLGSLGILLLAGCSSRERLNPFDPKNPDTGGRPAGFAAIAGNAIVSLQWQRAGAPGLLGYRLERFVDGDSAWRVIADLLPAHATGYGDFGARNGADHRYRLYFVFEAGPAVLPAEDVATPGPQRPWVADFDAGALLRLSPDARHVAFTDPGFDGPVAVDVDPVSGIVWTCDPYRQQVVVHVPGALLPRVIGGIPDPVAVAVDPRDTTAWIVDAMNDRLLHVDANGEPAPPQVLSPLHDAIAIAVDPRDRTLWVCENQGNKLRRFDLNGTPMWGLDMPVPSRVAVDSATGIAWVTSFQTGQVRRVHPQGQVLDTLSGFRGPIGVAVDWRRGRVWIAEAAADRVVVLNRDRTEAFRIGGVGEPREIAIDPVTGDAWVTAPGDRAVARLSGSGGATRKVTGLGFPADVAIDPGVR